MKLYHKKLKSLEDVQREKLALKSRMKDMEAEHLSSLSFLDGIGIKGKKNAATESSAHQEPAVEHENLMANIIEMAGPLLGTVMDFAFPILGTKVGKTVKKTVLNSVKSVGGKVIGGYLKWKAVELSTKALWRLAHRQSKKAE